MEEVHLSFGSSSRQTDEACLLDQGLEGHESDGALRQHHLGEADLAGAVEHSVPEHLGLGDRGEVADLERATGLGAHGLLPGEPLDGSSGKGSALPHGAVHPEGVGHGDERGVDAPGGGLDVCQPHPVVVATQATLVTCGHESLVQYIQDLAVVDHPVGGCVHNENAARPANSDEASEQTHNTVGHHFHCDHPLLSGLHLDSERCGRAGVAKCGLLNHKLVVLKEDHDVLDVVLLLGQDGVGVPLGAVGSHQVVAVVQVVAGGKLRTKGDKKTHL